LLQVTQPGQSSQGDSFKQAEKQPRG
jgi:hypothetical protein